MVAKMSSIMGSVNHGAVHTSLASEEFRKNELSLIGRVGIKGICYLQNRHMQKHEKQTTRNRPLGYRNNTLKNMLAALK